MNLPSSADKTIQERLSEQPGTIIKNHYGGYQRHSPRFLLGYWSTRCLAAPLRMLLSAAQVDHWVLLYDAKEDDTPGGWDKSSWWKDKEWLKKDFPLINLPFLVDCANGCVISQTNAIAAYLGRELKLLGTSKEDTAQCEELLCEITDLRDLMLVFAYKEDQSTIEAEAKKLLIAAKPYFEKLNQHMMMEYPDAEERYIDRDELDTVGFSNNSVCHLLDDKFSAPDFFLWEILNQFEGLCKRFDLPNCLGDATTYTKKVDKLNTGEIRVNKQTSVYPYLKEFHDSFLKLRANQAYLTQFGLIKSTDTDRAIKLPYNSPYARFGSCPSPVETYVRGQETPWRNRGVISHKYTRVETGIEYWDDEAVDKSDRKRKERGS